MRCFVIFGKRGGSLCTTMKQVHQIQGDYLMWKGIVSSTIILLAAQLLHAQTANPAWPYWGGNAYPAYGNNYPNYPGYSGYSNGYLGYSNGYSGNSNSSVGQSANPYNSG